MENYKKMWDELKDNAQQHLVLLKRGLNYYPSDIQKGSIYGVEGIIKHINTIESKYQPKQYTWNEILEMNPLSKHIKSMCSTDIYPLKENVYYVKEYTSYTDGNIYCFAQYRYPSIIEMKNKWTIVEE